MVQCSALTEEEASSRPWSAIWIKHDTAARRHCWQAEAKSPLFHFILLFFIPSSLGLFSTAFTVVAVKTQVFRSRHPGNITYDMSTHTHTHPVLLWWIFLNSSSSFVCAVFNPLHSSRAEIEVEKKCITRKTIVWTEIFRTACCYYYPHPFLPFFLFSEKEFPSFIFCWLLSCCLIFFFFHLFLFNLHWMSSASTPKYISIDPSFDDAYNIGALLINRTTNNDRRRPKGSKSLGEWGTRTEKDESQQSPVSLITITEKELCPLRFFFFLTGNLPHRKEGEENNTNNQRVDRGACA